MKSEHGLYIMLAGMIAAYFVVILVAVALFWPVKTLVINGYSDDQPLKVEQKVLRPGDQLTYTLDYCKYRDQASVVHRQLIDGQVITLQDTAGQLQSGCHVVTIKTAIIPETINPGRYYLDVKVDYPINPLRDNFIGPTRTHYRTEYFDVEAPVQKASTVIFGQPTVIYVHPAKLNPTPEEVRQPDTVIINNTVDDHSQEEVITPVPEPKPSQPDQGLGGIIRTLLPI